MIPVIESIWCRDCGEVRPLTVDRMKADERNDHDATDLVCDNFHIVATLHHPSDSTSYALQSVVRAIQGCEGLEIRYDLGMKMADVLRLIEEAEPSQPEGMERSK